MGWFARTRDALFNYIEREPVESDPHVEVIAVAEKLLLDCEENWVFDTTKISNETRGLVLTFFVDTGTRHIISLRVFGEEVPLLPDDLIRLDKALAEYTVYRQIRAIGEGHSHLNFKPKESIIEASYNVVTQPLLPSPDRLDDDRWFSLAPTHRGKCKSCGREVDVVANKGKLFCSIECYRMEKKQTPSLSPLPQKIAYTVNGDGYFTNLEPVTDKQAYKTITAINPRTGRSETTICHQDNAVLLAGKDSFAKEHAEAIDLLARAAALPAGEAVPLRDKVIQNDYTGTPPRGRGIKK